MKIKKSPADWAFDIANTAVMLLIAVVMLAPMLHVFSVSFSGGEEVLKGGLFLYPRKPTLLAYQKVFEDRTIMRSYLNTILYAASHTLLTLFFTSLTAYPLSIPSFRLRKFCTIYLTITMFIGGGTIPTYLLMQRLHLINNPLVMVIPFTVGAYNVILFRTFFSGIDAGIRESARIDGAGEFRILFQIVFPLSKAIFATVGLFTIVAKWNDWFSALIYLNDEAYYPVQMILRKILFNTRIYANMDPTMMQMFRDNAITPENLQMATIVIITLPIILVYPFIQKYFTKGVMIGGIKG